MAIAFAQNTRDEVREIGGNIAGALGSQPGMKQQTYAATRTGVRRLMPVECERLQGFPDGWTEWGVTDKGRVRMSDSARYRMLGNAVSVPVAEWLGRRIIAHENS